MILALLVAAALQSGSSPHLTLGVDLPPVDTPLAVTFANQTAFRTPCVDFVSTAPALLTARASESLARLGWTTRGAIGPQFTEGTALRLIGSAGAIYIHSHGDHYWDVVAHQRSSGVRVDGGLCSGAPTIIAPEIAASRERAGVPLASLVVISTCHNGEVRSKLPASFGIPQRKDGPGQRGVDAFYLSYSGIAWQSGMVPFEQSFWAALLTGTTTGEAFDRALLAGFAPDEIVPEWWGSYTHFATAPGSAGGAIPGGGYV